MREIPKSCACHHLTENGGSTCTQMGNSYRCSNCLRQERDAVTSALVAALDQRDEARLVARKIYRLGAKPPFPPDYESFEWLTAEEEEA